MKFPPKSTPPRLIGACAATLALTLAAAAPAVAESRLGDTSQSLSRIGPDKPYVVNPPLSAATIDKRKHGYFVGGGPGMTWHVPDKKEIEMLETRREGRVQSVLSR